MQAIFKPSKRSKLGLLLFVSSATIALVYMLVVFNQLTGKQQHYFQDFHHQGLVKARTLADISSEFSDLHSDLFNLLLIAGRRYDEEILYEHGIVLLDRFHTLEERLQVYTQTYLLKEDHTSLLADIAKHYSEYLQAIHRALDTATLDVVQSAGLLQDLNRHFVGLTTNFTMLTNSMQAESESAFHELQDFTEDSATDVFVLVILVIGIVIALAFYILVLMGNQMRILRNQAERLDAAVKQRTRELTKTNLQLQRASEVKNEFLSAMSHELRTPLNAISGFSELLLLEEQLPIELRDNISEIQRAGEALQDMVTDVLAMDSLEKHEVELNIEVVTVNSILGDVIKKHNSEAKLADIRIDFDWSDKIKAKADKCALNQIFSHLLRNAIRYNKPGGWVRFDYSLRDHVVRICVQDSGIGFDEDNFQSLSQPFERGKQDLHHVDGMGLGLAIVRELVLLQGGQMKAEKQQADGSIFWIELPAVKE